VSDKIYRAWVNQPSTLQPDHRLHGRVCIVVDDGSRPTVRLFFAEGEEHSAEAMRSSVSRLYGSRAEQLYYQHRRRA
jgi:hypothetical protein